MNNGNHVSGHVRFVFIENHAGTSVFHELELNDEGSQTL